MKHTKQNIIKLLKEMSEYAYNEYLKYRNNTESAFISFSKSQAYAIASKLLESKELFEDYVKEYFGMEAYLGD